MTGRPYSGGGVHGPGPDGQGTALREGPKVFGSFILFDHGSGGRGDGGGRRGGGGGGGGGAEGRGGGGGGGSGVYGRGHGVAAQVEIESKR